MELEIHVFPILQSARNGTKVGKKQLQQEF